MSTHCIGFYEDLTKIIFELSSSMHLISSASDMCLAWTEIPKTGFLTMELECQAKAH